MKPRLWSAIVTFKVDLMIANVHTPERKDVVTFALEELANEDSTRDAMIEDGPREVGSIVAVPDRWESSIPYGPVEDNPEELSCETILSLPEPKPVEPLGVQLEFEVDE